MQEKGSGKITIGLNTSYPLPCYIVRRGLLKKKKHGMCSFGLALCTKDRGIFLYSKTKPLDILLLINDL